MCMAKQLYYIRMVQILYTVTLKKKVKLFDSIKRKLPIISLNREY